MNKNEKSFLSCEQLFQIEQRFCKKTLKISLQIKVIDKHMHFLVFQ